MKSAKSDARTPLICIDQSAVIGAEIFNPNFWTAASKGIIQSCWSEYSVLHHCVWQIDTMCNQDEWLCKSHINTLQEQWSIARFDLRKLVIFGQNPDLHMRIHAFFSGMKSLLDLLVQLLRSENIVLGVVDGFHRAQHIYGGRVLNALRNNAPDNHKESAGKLAVLILQHKATWIDEAIAARDHLIHPKRGMHQIMFHLDLAEQEGELVCRAVDSPQIGSVSINKYSKQVLEHAADFSSAFLALVREATVSGSDIERTR